MKKVVVHRAGSYDELRLEEHAVPQPGAGEVRVEAEAIGVNFADCIVRMGLYQSAKDYVGWPITPGFEAAGRVAALGEGVDDLAVGDEVFLVTRFGGYAEQIVAPRRQVFLRPEAMSPSEAASFPSVFLTASYALFELGAAREGQVMLVHSAAGGVGGALCQLGKAIGCRVVGVVGGSHKVETARKAGADVVIDKSKEDLWAAAESAAPSGYDLVFDANGVATLKQSYEHLAAPGRVVVYGFHTMFSRGGRGRPNWFKLAWGWLRTPRFNPLDMTTRNRSVLAFNLSYLFDNPSVLEEHMEKLLGYIDAGKIRPAPVTEFALSDVGKAQQAIESGRTVGKLVLRTSGGA